MKQTNLTCFPLPYAEIQFFQNFGFRQQLIQDYKIN